jgi:membrane-bound lytic murein transglycosylase D
MRRSSDALIPTVCMLLFNLFFFVPNTATAGDGSNASVGRSPTTTRTEAASTTPVLSHKDGPDDTFDLNADDENREGPSEEGGSSRDTSLDAALDLTETAWEYWTGGDEEKSLEALDRAYQLLIETECGDNPEMARQKEDLRYLISRRILEIYASRVRTVKGTHKAIPITINRHVQREIELLTSKERHFFLTAYKRSGRYREEIVKSLKQAGMPEELSWLPLIESGFKVKAYSRARALGLWQFIPSTGYRFGLKRTAWIDERMDPTKSTRAAIDYLKELHSIFGDWATVLAAYNCGERAVLRAIGSQKRDYLDNFWDLYDRLPSETARYYPRFLAVLVILKDPERYGIELGNPELAPEFDEVTVPQQINLKTAARRLAVPFEDLAALNPELRRAVTPGPGYSLKVPAGSSASLLARIDTLPAWQAPKSTYTLHRVRRGENLSLLALRYRTSTSAIVHLNKLHGNVILAGQRLKIPLTGL